MYHPETVRYLVSAFENDIKIDPNRIGFCGTSIQALEYLLEHQVLPKVTIKAELTKSKKLPKPHLSLFPIQETFPKHRLSPNFLPSNLAFKAAAEYAQSMAVIHSLLANLRIPVTDTAAHNWAIILTGFVTPGSHPYNKALTQFLGVDLSISKRTLEEAINSAMEKAKGVVLGIDQACLRHIPGNALAGDEAHELFLPTNINYRSISTAEPQGDLEYEFFVNLQDMFLPPQP